MALITVRTLAIGMRVHGDTTTDPEEPIQSTVTRLLTVSDNWLTQHTRGRLIMDDSDPPVALLDDSVRNEAIVLMCTYLYDKPSSSRGISYANAFVNSGAKELITPYIYSTAGVV